MKQFPIHNITKKGTKQRSFFTKILLEHWFAIHSLQQKEGEKTLILSALVSIHHLDREWDFKLPIFSFKN